QLDGRVERERGELLALRLLDALGLLLRELAQAAHEVLGVAAEGESEAAAAFHAGKGSDAGLVERKLVVALDIGGKYLHGTERRLHRGCERRSAALTECLLEPARRDADRIEVRAARNSRLGAPRGRGGRPPAPPPPRCLPGCRSRGSRRAVRGAPRGSRRRRTPPPPRRA